jgi:hypothetical protein
MKRIQKAIFAEKPILDQYNCNCERVPHLFLVKKEANKALLEDLTQNIEEQKLAPDVPIEETLATASQKHHVIHYDHLYHDPEETSKYCDVMAHPSGWRFYSFHRHILHEHEIQQLLQRMKKELLSNFPSVSKEVPPEQVNEWIGHDHLDFNGFKLHLPPVLFGIDVMFLEFLPNTTDPAPPSQARFALSVDPSDAIFSWVMKVIQQRVFFLFIWFELISVSFFHFSSNSTPKKT